MVVRLNDGIKEQSPANANKEIKTDITIPIEESLDSSLPEQSSSNTDQAKGFFAGVKRRTWIVGGALFVVFLIALLLAALLVGIHRCSMKSSLGQQQPLTLFSSSSQPTSSMPPSPSSGPTTSYTGISSFYAIGDVPYNVMDAVRLEEQMSNIPQDARFVIHLGDLRSASDDPLCKQSDYTDVASILRLSRAPVFVIKGDNDWNDCPNIKEGRNFWENEFNSFDTKYWNHTLQVVRQPKRKENFAFVDQGTLFIGLNIVGGRVHNQNEWETRLTDQVEWTMDLIRQYNPGSVVIFGHADPTQNHNAFFAPLTEFIANELQNQLPILYLNGDKHAWNYEPSLFDQPSLLRITVTGGTSEPPLKISAGTGKSAVEEVFTYDRQL